MKVAQRLEEVHNMSEAQIQRTEQPTAAFVLSLLAGLWMLGAGGMMGGLRLGRHDARLARHGWLDVGAGRSELWGVVALVWSLRRDSRTDWRSHALSQARAAPKLGHSHPSCFGSKHLFLGMMGLLAGTMGVIGGVLALSTRD